MAKRNKHQQAGTPTMSQRWGLLSVSALMLVALVIMLCRQEDSAPTKCEEELIPLRQMQQYKPVQAAADSTPAPQKDSKAKKERKAKKTKKGKRGKAPKKQGQQAPPRKINEETLTPQ